MAANGEGLIVADLDIAEVHQAALELIGATGTVTLEEALESPRRSRSLNGPPPPRPPGRPATGPGSPAPPALRWRR